MALIADTSGLLAAINGGDRAHEDVRRCLERERGPILVPDLVIAEVDYLLLRHVGRAAEEAFLEDLADGSLARAGLQNADLVRALEIVRRYREGDVGVIDATIVALAERLSVDRVLTLDLRHFRSFQLPSQRPFVILPADA